jgi:hypothetical protein
MGYRVKIVIALIILAAAAVSLATVVIFSEPAVKAPAVSPPAPLVAIGAVAAVEAFEYVDAYSVPEDDFSDTCEIAPGGKLVVLAAGAEKVAAAYQAPEDAVFSPRPCLDGAVVLVEARRFAAPTQRQMPARPSTGRIDRSLDRPLPPDYHTSVLWTTGKPKEASHDSHPR